MFEMVKKRFNFTITKVPFVDFGLKLQNGSWYGTVNDLVHGIIDVGKKLPCPNWCFQTYFQTLINS